MNPDTILWESLYHTGRQEDSKWTRELREAEADKNINQYYEDQLTKQDLNEMDLGDLGISGNAISSSVRPPQAATSGHASTLEDDVARIER